MKVKLDFFTPVSFGNQPKSFGEFLLETTDQYFSLHGKQAVVITNSIKCHKQRVTIEQREISYFINALKVVSYVTIIIPAVLFILKVVMRSTRSFQINSEQKIKRDTERKEEISREIIQKIRDSMLLGVAVDGVEVTPKLYETVFRVKSAPTLIFTKPNASIKNGSGVLRSPRERIEDCIQNMIKARSVCLENRLDLLIIPDAKGFRVDKSYFIVEQIPDIPKEQKQLWVLEGLDETLKQLVTFINKTGYSSITPQNVSILEADTNFQGNRRVILHNLEQMDSAELGILGNDWNLRGLMGCLGSEHQINLVAAEVKKKNICDHDKVEKRCQKRIQELKV